MTQNAGHVGDHTQGALVRTQSAPPASTGSSVIPWDPFTLMDRLDADAFVAEMQGIASDVLIYTVKDGGKEMTALSKGGIDECCTMLVTQGQCIRELELRHEMIGEGEQKEGIFTCIAARFAVHADGREVKLDQVIGVKREQLYEERAPLTLDSRVPGKKWREAGQNGQPLTYREALDHKDARGYLEWIVSGSNFDDATKTFVQAILDGVDVQEFAAGKRFNPFWYEHGAMKAARNARSRLIPAGVKAQVIAMAKGSARERVAARPGAESQEARSETRPPSASTSTTKRKTTAKATVTKSDDGTLRGEYKGAGWTGTGATFPYDPYKGIPLNARYVKGAVRQAKAGSGSGAPEEPRDVSGAFVISHERLLQCDKWARERLDVEKKKRDDGQPDDEKLSYFSDLIQDVEVEGKARAAEAQQTPAGT